MQDLLKIVIPRINAEWENVAYALCYSIPNVKTISRKHKDDPEKCCKELLTDWLTTNNGARPKTWSTLFDKLNEVSELTAAREEIIELVQAANGKRIYRDHMNELNRQLFVQTATDVSHQVNQNSCWKKFYLSFLLVILLVLVTVYRNFHSFFINLISS